MRFSEDPTHLSSSLLGGTPPFISELTSEVVELHVLYIGLSTRKSLLVGSDFCAADCLFCNNC